MTTEPDRDHGVCWLLPVRRDLDGTVLVLCHADFEAGTPVDAWAVWCPSCRQILPGTELAGSRGLPSIDGLPEAAWESARAWEVRWSTAHAADVAAPVARAVAVGTFR